ncbi:hypothetical protein [Nonomuraea rhizosphaerae]|uniref:hypothetical protein n=1 Tax=Nonomuraea rhizosphaerae TaxID=2665663 RepID=UPI001C5DC910|nr:hypothetical protein [Nonomuraea rhizosphaerae]
MPTPEAPPAPAPPEKPSGSRAARRIGCLALLSAPFLLLAALVMAPVWITDHRLARMADRVLAYPPPPGTDVEHAAPQVEVSGGDSGDCWYSIRFELSTDRPVQEVLSHYRRARFEDPDGDLGDHEFAAWTLFDEGGTPAEDTSTSEPVIIDLYGTYTGSWADMRCW